MQFAWNANAYLLGKIRKYLKMSSAEILSRMLSVNLAQLVETLLKLLPKLIVYGRKKEMTFFVILFI